MGRYLSLISVLLCLSLLTDCSQKPKAGATAPGAGLYLATDAHSGFCLTATTIWEHASDGTYSRKASAQIGDVVQVLEGPASAKLPGWTKEADILRVRHESGTEGWMRADYVAVNSVLGVTTTDDSAIYTLPRNTAATAQNLPVLTIVAITRTTAGQTFVRVAFFDKTKGPLRDVFLRNEGISTKADDVQTALLLILAQQAKDKKLQNTLLQSALSDYPGSLFSAQVQEGVQALKSPTAGKNVQTYTAALTAASKDVPVLSIPDEIWGQSVGTLAKGQAVEAIEETSATDTVGTDTAQWIHIKDPEGWVFGAYLTESQPASNAQSDGSQ